MEDTELKRLFDRYLAGKADPEEVRWLIQQFDNSEAKAELRRLVREQIVSGYDESLGPQPEWNPMLHEAYEAIKKKLSERRPLADSRRIRSMKWRKYSVAAAVAILVGTSILLLVNREKDTLPPPMSIHKSDIAPGGNKATLTLANGTTIILDTTGNGVISVQGNTKVSKTANGLLTYRQSGSAPSKALINVIKTPRGGQYQVVLSDGTKVWLNAGSSIRFPNEFTGRTREVGITGEAYFEVADNANKPFEVLVNDMTIRVLGTHLNVMAYPDEPVKTVTLLEGALKVDKGSQSVTLKPGQQARVDPDGGLTKVDHIDLEGIIAWKNNQFWFNDDDIHTVTRELSRWYNAKIVVKGEVSQHFGGIISRDLYVSKIFEALQATSHIQFEIQDSIIIVSP